MLLGEHGIINTTIKMAKDQKIAEKTEEVNIAIATVLLDHEGDSSKVTISAVVNEIRKNYSDDDKNKIRGEATGEKENRFPGEIIYTGSASGISEDIIVAVDGKLKPEANTESNEPDEFSQYPDANIEDSEYKQNGNIFYYEPDLTGFNREETFYITYNVNNSSLSTVTGNLAKSEQPANWYDYQNGKWANIVTINDGMIAYWVWVPRYMYKTNADDSTVSSSTVEAKFVDLDNKCYLIENGNKVEKDVTGYRISDGFKFDDTDLKGFWMSKYAVGNITYSDNIHIKETRNSATITVAEPSGTYTLFVNGRKYSDNITLPYTINNINTSNPYKLILVQNSSGKIINTMTKETLEPEELKISLEGFNPECTYFVTYNSDNQAVVSEEHIIVEDGEIMNAPEGWYDYRNGKWANIMTNNDGIIAYWTWVPRYQYRVFPDGTLDAIFIKNSKTVADRFFTISDGFTFDGNNLSGFWMSKYAVGN